MSIRETIELQDLFSPVIKQIVSSVNYAVTAMEQMQSTMKKPLDTGAVKSARKTVDDLNDSMEQMKKVSENAKKSFGQTGDEVGRFGQRSGSAAENIGNLFVSLGSYKILSAVKSAFVETTNSAIEFESAITGIYKTVDATPTQLGILSDTVKKMSTEIPSTTTEIAGVMESAGQLGIELNGIEDFTRTVINLSNSTNLTSDNAAPTIAKFANVTDMDESQYSNLGSAIVALGNNFATTEAEIVDMTSYLASAATLAGMSQADILGLATAMLSVGINAEAGGSSMSRLITQMQLAVETGDGLEDFASVADMSVSQFADSFENNAVGAVQTFISGLNDIERNGMSVSAILQQMDLDDIRLSNTIKAMASGSDVLTSAISTASSAWSENTALTNEATKRYQTLESELQITKNTFGNLKIAIGDSLTPALEGFNNVAVEATDTVARFAEKNPVAVSGIAAFTGTVGTAVGAIGTFAPAVASVTYALKTLIPVASTAKLLLGGGIAIAGVAALVGIGTAIYTSAKKAENAVEDYNGTLKQCTEEMESVRGQYEAAKEAFGENSDAAQALASDLETLNAQYEKGGGAAADYAQRITQNIEDWNKLKSSYQEQLTENDNTVVNDIASVNQLTALSDKAVKTADDLEYMRSIAETLNQKYNLDIEVSYNGSVTGFDKQQLTGMAVAEATSNRKELATKSLTGTEYQNNYFTAEENYNNISTQYDELLKEYEKQKELFYMDRTAPHDKLETLGTQLFGEQWDIRSVWWGENDPNFDELSYNYSDEEIKSGKAGLYHEIKFSKQEFDNISALGREWAKIAGIDYDSYIKDLSKSMLISGERPADASAYNDIYNYQGGLADMISDVRSVSVAVDENSEAVKNNAVTLSEEGITALENYAQRVQEVYNAERQKLDNMFSTFESAELVDGKMNIEIEGVVNFDTAMENIQSQIDYFEEYQVAVDTILKYDIYDNAKQTIQQYLSELTPEQTVKLYTELETKGDEEAVGQLETLAGKIDELSLKKDEIATTFTQINSDVSDAWTDTINTISQSTNGLNLQSKALTMSQTTMNGYIKGLVKGGDDAVSAIEAIKVQIQEALNTLPTQVGVNVSTTVSNTEKWASVSTRPGKMLQVEGNATGTTNSADIFIAGEKGPELIIGKQGSSVFPVSETNRIISAVSGTDISENYTRFFTNENQIINNNQNTINNYCYVDFSLLDKLTSAINNKSNYVSDNTYSFDFNDISDKNDIHNRDYLISHTENISTRDESTENSENISRKEIFINFGGEGEIKIDGMGKEEILEVMLNYAKPVLANIISTEIFEEGDASYDY